MSAASARKNSRTSNVNKRATTRREQRTVNQSRATGTTSPAKGAPLNAKNKRSDSQLIDPKKTDTTMITVDDPALDKKIIEGMLNDRERLMSEMEALGYTAEAVLRRAADLGLSEAYLRHVQTVAADLAGDRPGARRIPSHLRARTCLSCERVFLSSGPGNRICPRCRGADAGLAQL